MEYFLTERQQMFRDLARKIAEERVLPVRAELDESGEFPWDLMKEMAQADMFRIFVRQEYGGFGGGCLDQCLVMEELSRVCSGVAICYAASGMVAYPIGEFGTAEQKQKYLPDIAEGKRLCAFALTEPQAGSDAGAIKTTATLEGDEWVINGTKQFITNGGEAEIYIVFALTDPSRGSRGASALIVEKGMPGFAFGKKEEKMGIRASATRELVFRNCRVPKENILSSPSSGFIVALRTIGQSRPVIGAQAVGLAQGAYEAALDYANQRQQFGQTIGSFQAVSHMLANMAMEIEAARALVYATARTIDSGAKDFVAESAMAKVFASDMAMRVTTNAVQILGGPGYMKDYPVEKMMRDAKIIQIYEGTNEILRNVMARDLFKRREQKKKA